MYRVVFTIHPQKEEEMADRLFEAGAQSVSVEDIDEPELRMTGIFDKKDMLAQQFPGFDFMITEMEEMSWKYRWMEYFHGTEVTEHIYIESAGYSSPVSCSYDHVIQLDPRDAFGDGGHPTTRMCALMMEKYLQGMGEDEKGQVGMLDVGTGTGILAIIARKLGVVSIQAFDVDDPSVARARENAFRNGCGDISFFTRDLAGFTPENRYSLVVANLLTFIIEKNMKYLKNLLSPDGVMILSGIGKEWEDEIKKLFTLHKLQIIEDMEEGEWKGFMLKCTW